MRSDRQICQIALEWVGNLMRDARTRRAGNAVTGADLRNLIAIPKYAAPGKNVENLVLKLMGMEWTARCARRNAG